MTVPMVLVIFLLSISKAFSSPENESRCSSSNAATYFTFILRDLRTCDVTAGPTDDVGLKIRQWLTEMEASALPMLPSSVEMHSSEPQCDTYKETDVRFIYIETTDGKYELSSQASLADLSGSGKIVFHNNVTLSSSNFTRGYVSGEAIMDFGSLLLLQGFMSAGSCWLGLVRGYEQQEKQEMRLVSVSTYGRGGLREGPFWHRLLSTHDRSLVGLLYMDMPRQLQKDRSPWYSCPSATDFSGENVAFIYPDITTAILGSFETGTLIKAQQVTIKSISDNGGLSFSSPYGPSFRRDVSNRTFISSDPLLRDPYETLVCEVRASTIAAAGQGVFLKRSVAKNTIVSFFNGVRLKEKEVFDIFGKRSVYLVELGEEDDFLDIPPEYTGWNAYQASAGHKVNHGRKANSGYTECDHPRFGKILCLRTLKNMEAGEELFTQYDVAFDKNGMKDLLKTVLNVGYFFSGKSKKEFVHSVKPYLQAASKMTENIKVDDLVRF